MEWVSSIIIGTPIGLLLAAVIFEKLAWTQAGIGIGILIGILFFVFPFVTKFQKIESKQHENE